MAQSRCTHASLEMHKIEPAGVQPGQPVASARAAKKNRRVVADELAAEAGENRRTPNHARPLLLAAAGGKPPNAVVVWEHAGKDRGISNRIDGASTERDFSAERDWRRKSV